MWNMRLSATVTPQGWQQEHLLKSAAQNEWNIRYSLAHTLGESKYSSVESFSISIRDEAFNINLHHNTSKNTTIVLSKWLEL